MFAGILLYKEIIFFFFCFTVRASDKRIVRDEELSDSEDEGEGRRDRMNYKPKAKRPRTEDERKEGE